MSGVSKKAKKVPKRWLGAFKRGHRFSDRAFIDEDQAWEMLERWEESGGSDKEAEQVLDYLTKFNNEYYRGVLKKGDPNALHNTDELRKSVYDRQNAKNRDIMSVQNETVKRTKFRPNEDDNNAVDAGTDDLDTVGKSKSRYTPTLNETEDTLIEILDGIKLFNTPEDPEQ
jgi:hypothetical protein